MVRMMSKYLGVLEGDRLLPGGGRGTSNLCAVPKQVASGGNRIGPSWGPCPRSLLPAAS